MTEKRWNQVSLAAIVFMAATLLYSVLVPIPSTAKVVNTLRKQDAALESEAKEAMDEVGVLQAQNVKRLWAQPADQVSAAAMAKVTELAKKQELRIIAFRPQRIQEEGSIVRYPYQISVEGYFPKVLAFIRALETPNLKIPVVSVQIASADGASDKVTSTVGIVAFKESVATRP